MMVKKLQDESSQLFGLPKHNEDVSSLHSCINPIINEIKDRQHEKDESAKRNMKWNVELQKLMDLWKEYNQLEIETHQEDHEKAIT